MCTQVKSSERLANGLATKCLMTFAPQWSGQSRESAERVGGVLADVIANSMDLSSMEAYVKKLMADSQTK
jgi:hypothetical protein